MKNTFLSGLICLSLLSWAEGSAASAPKDSVSLAPAEVAERLIAAAREHLGKPYRYGAEGPSSFDCSGLTGCVYARYGFKLSRSARGQATDGRAVEGPWSHLQKGDLLIFGSRHHKRAVGHVGLFIALDSTGTDFTFIHASRRGVIVSHILEGYYRERFLGARRLLPDFVEGDRSAPEAAAALDTLVGRKVVPDGIRLSAGDRRIILFENGSWAYVDGDGTLFRPGEGDRILMRADGSWQLLRASRMTIPRPEDETPSPAKKQEASYHTIVAGDTLWRIASRYHTSVDALCRLNGISRTATLRPGRSIRVR